MVQDHSGAGSNTMNRQGTTIFATLSGVRRCKGQAFFDGKSGSKIIKIDTAIPPGYRRVLKNG